MFRLLTNKRLIGRATISIGSAYVIYQTYSISMKLSTMQVTRSNAFQDDESIEKITLKNESNGTKCEIMTMGASILSFKCPDRDGKVEEVTIQVRDSLKDFLDINDKYYGAVRSFQRQHSNTNTHIPTPTPDMWTCGKQNRRWKVWTWW